MQIFPYGDFFPSKLPTRQTNTMIFRHCAVNEHNKTKPDVYKTLV